jgi:pimeloyl-ACP methyl ester carboxylesterase
MIRWDMRGHGRSETPDDSSCFSQDLTVADMAALLDHLGVERAIIAGHSLGGFMTLRFQATYPDRVIGLILQGTGPGFRNADAREKCGHAVLSGGAEVGESHQGSAKGLANAARGMLTHVDAKVIDNLSNIDVPTIIIVGANDANFIGAGEYMNKKVKDTMHFVIADAGHGCNVEQPEQVNNALAEFFEKF